MGLQTEGTLFSWEELIPHLEKIKKLGVEQYINLYYRHKDRQEKQLKWGDEIEYAIVKFDHANKKVRVSCRAAELINTMHLAGKVNELVGKENHGTWHHECAAYMIESTPAEPADGSLDGIGNVEANMRARREDLNRFLDTEESLLSICYPALGVPDFTDPPMKLLYDNGDDSLFSPPDAFNLKHPRYQAFMSNVRERRGSKICINVPIYKDKRTMSPYIEDFSSLGMPGGASSEALPDHIYMDHTIFGAGLCCLQITLQTPNVESARWLYDQFIPFSPIVMALSASTPIFRSKLSDVDCRWDIISASMDDRTAEERGLKPLKNSEWRFERSRYGTTECYLHPSNDQFNDIPVQYHDEHFQQLMGANIDETMAKFIAHLFVRDPMPIFHEVFENSNATDSAELFEAMLTSNWNNVRFKPPPSCDPSIGWRVEFRPTEVQLTDFENAAFVCFTVLLSRLIMTKRFQHALPISMIIENMKRAQRRDAVGQQKFYFRNDLTAEKSVSESDVQEMCVNEIINGTKSGFPGIIPLMRKYLSEINVNDDTMKQISRYLEFISKRASGEIWTLAHWVRDFVDKHPSYKHDSEVPADTIYDMLKKMDAISKGAEHCDKLLGKTHTTTKVDKTEFEFLKCKSVDEDEFIKPIFSRSFSASFTLIRQ